MSIKKRILLAMASITCLLTSVGYAGGVEVAPAPSVGDTRYLFLEANAGYGNSSWRGNVGPGYPFALGGAGRDGGFTYGLDGGFMFTRYVGLELGAYGLPSVNATSIGLFPFAIGSIQVNSWFAYASGKVEVPLLASFDVFGKVGGAYRGIAYQGPGALGISNNGYWTPMFGAGAEYGWSSWTLNAQYLRVPGYGNTNQVTRRAPAANLATLGIGYRFSF